jgi:hypothetical protein
MGAVGHPVVRAVTQWTRRSARAARGDLYDAIAALDADDFELVRAVNTGQPIRRIALPPASPTYWMDTEYPMASHATCRHKDSHKRYDCQRRTRLTYETDNGQASLYFCVAHHREAINKHTPKRTPNRGS